MTILVLCVALLTVKPAPFITKAELLRQLQPSQIHANNLTLLEVQGGSLSVTQLRHLLGFLTDSETFANLAAFDISAFSNWEDYNYYRPQSEVVMAILARRDLFLDPARQLNNPAITNMSDEALAALIFSQTYVEEKWDHTVPWDGEPNRVFNWIQPELLVTPNWDDFVNGDFLFRERVRYWFATFEPHMLEDESAKDLGDGNDVQAALAHIRAPVSNVPRLAGYSYPIGNQLYLQSAESLLWYADYLKVAKARHGQLTVPRLDTSIRLPEDSTAILEREPPLDWEFHDFAGLWGLLHAPFAEDLRLQLSHPEKAAFWNVMRFVHAGARQREGGGSAERPGDNQPAIMALRYSERSDTPQGRNREDISAFSLITTVYSDSILLDFSNWNAADQSLIVQPLDDSRSDGIHRQLSERNKAIRVVEHMGDENKYYNARHVAGSLGLGLQLVTKFDDPAGDFLPYTPEEASFLMRALATEAIDFGIEESAETFCRTPLLRRSYQKFSAQNEMATNYEAWSGIICSQ